MFLKQKKYIEIPKELRKKSKKKRKEKERPLTKN